MYLLNRDILCINDGVIVAIVDCEARFQPSTTKVIWEKYPTAYKKYREHLTLQNWQPGKIQLIKVDDSFWICNLAGKKCHKLDPEILQEAFVKLRDWSSQQELKLYIPFESGFDESEWFYYIRSLNNFFPKSTLCFSDFSIENFLTVLKKPDFSLKELIDLISKKSSSLKDFIIRIPASSNSSFALGRSGGYGGEGSRIRVISLNDLSVAINDLLKMTKLLQLSNELNSETSRTLTEYMNSLLEKIQSIPRKYKVRKSDGSEHTGVPLDSVFEILQNLLDDCEQ